MILLIVAIVSSCVALFYYFGSTPCMHQDIDRSELNAFMEVLLKRGYENGYLVIQPSRTNKSFRISKYYKLERRGLFIEFIDDGWIAPCFDALISELRKGFIDFDLKKGAVDCLTMDFGTDVEKAAGVIDMLFVNVLKMDTGATFDAHFKNVGYKEGLEIAGYESETLVICGLVVLISSRIWKSKRFSKPTN